MKRDRGNIWLVELTKTPDDTIGHEQDLTRPCLVIANLPNIKMTTIIPLTSKLHANKLPHTYLVKKNTKNGLTTDSIALIFQIRSLSYERFITYKGEIDKQDLNRILEILKQYLRI